LKYASLDAAYYMGKTLLWCGSVMGKCAEKKLSVPQKTRKGCAGRCEGFEGVKQVCSRKIHRSVAACDLDDVRLRALLIGAGTGGQD
jgi:hypothetical protein